MRSWLSRFFSSKIKATGRNDKRATARIRRSGLFDEKWYLQQYPEVANSGIDPVEHYLRIGGHSGKNPSPLFDSKDYLEAYSDVGKARINPLLHYLKWGQQEGRYPLPYGSPDMPIVTSGADAEPRYRSVLDHLVKAAHARLEPEGKSVEYDVIRSEFDIPFYLTCNDDVARNNQADPIMHYIKYGAIQGRDPSPEFSTTAYLDRYPEVRKSGVNPFYHWLKEGREKGCVGSPFKEFEGLSQMLDKRPQDVQERLSASRADLRARLDHGILGDMVAKAAELDPLISHTWPEAFKVKQPPFHSDPVVSNVVALRRLQEAAQLRRAKVVLVVNRPRWGGTRRMEGHLAHILAEFFGPEEIAVLGTDVSGKMPSGKLPDGCRYIDFARLTREIEPETRERILVEFLRSLRPTSVFNINSRLLWNALAIFDKALSASTDVYACMFCNEQTRFGHWTGYPLRNFYRRFDVLRGVCTDSHALAEWLIKQYKVPPSQRDRIAVLEAPVDPALQLVQAPEPAAVRRPQVFWSGRFDRQKRIDVVYALAECMPQIDFRMWGEPVLDKSIRSLRKPINVIHEGVYESFVDLPLEQCDLWLYTSEWDGVPSILLELSMTGLPIVGSLAGGTGEILDAELSWPIADINDVDAYRRAIEEILGDPDGARERARRLREAVLSQRTPEAYRATLEKLLSTGASA